MKNLTMYQISDEFMAAAERLSDLELPAEVIADTLDGMAMDFETKATHIAKFIRGLESQSDAIKEAEAKMAERRKAIDARADRVKEYLLQNMQRTGIKKIESPWFVLSIRKNPHKVIIDAAGQIPGDLYVYPPAPEPYPDKKAIKEAIQSGKEIAGAHLEQGESLSIK